MRVGVDTPAPATRAGSLSEDPEPAAEHPQDDAARRLGFWLALATSVLTAITFGLALTAIPDAGRNCRTDCAVYPFTSDAIANQFPGDYFWMFSAMALMVAFVGLVASIHHHARASRKVFSSIGLSLAVISAAVLLIDYFIQVTVMPLSLEKGQLEGWALFTQYNPNGVFLALEELGFLLMSFVFLVLAPVFAGPGRAEKALRRLFVGSFSLSAAALVAVSAVYGFDRQDTFEIAAISVVWLTLIAAGPLLAVVFRRSRPAADMER